MHETLNMTQVDVMTIDAFDVPWSKVEEVLDEIPHLEKLHVSDIDQIPTLSPIRIHDPVSVPLGAPWYMKLHNWLWIVLTLSGSGGALAYFIKQRGCRGFGRPPQLRLCPLVQRQWRRHLRQVVSLRV